MTDQLREAAWAALDALERSRAYVYETDRPQIDGAMDGLRAALAEQDHLRDATKMIGEPVAWGIIASNTGRICRVELDAEEIGEYKPEHVVPLYTAPRCREWVGLTDEEIADIALNCYSANDAEFDDFKIARAIEAKLKECNHD